MWYGKCDTSVAASTSEEMRKQWPALVRDEQAGEGWKYSGKALVLTNVQFDSWSDVCNQSESLKLPFLGLLFFMGRTLHWRYSEEQ